MRIFGTRIDCYTKDRLTDSLSSFITGHDKKRISKINTEFLLRAKNNQEYCKLINSSDLNIVDGRGVLWAARYLTLSVSEVWIVRFFQAIWQMIYSGMAIVFCPNFIKKPIPEAIPGVEAFELMMKVASDHKVGVFLFGGNEDVLKLAASNIKQQFPDLIISGTLNGYDFQKDKKINPVDIINKSAAKVLIVALGSPRQEKWILENIDKLHNVRIAVGEGGTLDRIATPSQKAPKLVNKIGLEWLWRLLFNKSQTESRSRFGRFWNSVPVFIYQVVKWKIKYGQTKI